MTARKAVGGVCVALGFGLDVFYSVARYKQDGIPWQIGAGLGVAMSAFLILLSINKARLLLAVVVFQIMTTSPGQTFSMLERQNNTGVEKIIKATDDQTERDKQELASIQADIERDQKTLDAIPMDIETQAKYRTTIAKLKTSIDANRGKKTEITNRIEANTDKAVTAESESVKMTNIYAFYCSISSWHGREWIMFFLHTFLSLLITLMSPYGVRAIIRETGNKKEEEPKEEVKEEPSSMPISEWVDMVWYGERTTPKKLRVPRPEVIARYCELYKKKVTVEDHAKRMTQAHKLGLIGDNGDLLGTSEDAKKLISAYLE